MKTDIEQILAPRKTRGKKGNKSSKNETPKLNLKANRSFIECLNCFRTNVDKDEWCKSVYEEMKRMFGEDVSIGKLPLATTMKIKQIRVQRDYYYFSIRGNKKVINCKCIPSWLACIASEALNQNKISRVEYQSFFKKYLWRSLQSKKPTTPKKRRWVSVVSVPFGGMNRR